MSHSDDDPETTEYGHRDFVPQFGTVMERLQGSFHDWLSLQENWGSPTGEQQCMSFILQAVESVHVLQNAMRFVHNDLTACNIMWQPTSAGTFRLGSVSDSTTSTLDVFTFGRAIKLIDFGFSAIRPPGAPSTLVAHGYYQAIEATHHENFTRDLTQLFVDLLKHYSRCLTPALRIFLAYHLHNVCGVELWQWHDKPLHVPGQGTTTLSVWGDIYAFLGRASFTNSRTAPRFILHEVEQYGYTPSAEDGRGAAHGIHFDFDAFCRERVSTTFQEDVCRYFEELHRDDDASPVLLT